MRLLLIAFITGLATLLGCSSIPKRHKTVWVINEYPVRTTFNLRSGDTLPVEMITKMLKDFNVLLYDAFDGQIRINKFKIYGNTKIGATHPGVANLYPAPDKDKGYYPHGFATGLPHKPRETYSPAFYDGSARILIHEFLHSWLGLYDEYQDGKGEEARCPELLQQHLDSDACLMNNHWHKTELCRKEDHNPYTEQGERRKMPCYEWAAEVIKKFLYVELVVPEEQIEGPTDPPEPKFEIIYDE